MTNHAHNTRPATAYVDAPSIIKEICWVAKQSADGPASVRRSRAFWLRKAALFDRIAIKEAAMYVPEVAAEVVDTAALAARQLVAFDVEYSGLSLRGSELITDDDCREYVRQEYREWSHARPS
ncbi:hypothetical protein [Streptomyces sp. UNOB3_S3]|uniref:hypothetical protein n=1 Tax=Streptomyces sp. UNOB3_S3 TaxID=2871682 RepID=UPI001E5CE168|nr:hypothetical protein [Streptomyces sp. UNOB3_S3]MCC3774075.1 hypothetical protein [Streptomyces sp. UNOB3_S3]